jgi:hypothetical protein
VQVGDVPPGGVQQTPEPASVEQAAPWALSVVPQTPVVHVAVWHGPAGQSLGLRHWTQTPLLQIGALCGQSPLPQHCLQVPLQQCRVVPEHWASPQHWAPTAHVPRQQIPEPLWVEQATPLALSVVSQVPLALQTAV